MALTRKLKYIDMVPGTRFRVLAGLDDGMGTAIYNCIVTFARVVGAVCRDVADFLVLRDLVEKVEKVG